MKRELVTVTTDSIGDNTTYTAEVVNGRILSIQYVKDSTSPFDDGVVVIITTELTAQSLWTETSVDASQTSLPRQPTHDLIGGAKEYANSYPVLEPIYVANERIKIVIDEGGDAKTGKFYITVG